MARRAGGELGGEDNLAGKLKNLFLVTIDLYSLENREMEVCRVSGGCRLGEPMGG